MAKLTSRANKFLRLVSDVQACRDCPRMDDRRRVLSKANGSLRARVLFIAEAPGRLGADRTGIPLYGDQSGRNFEQLLTVAGLKRSEVFITNTVLCNPREETGNNGKPTQAEITNCRRWLMKTIALVDPLVIVTVGKVALVAVAPDIELARNVARAVPLDGRILFPVYHTSPRVLVFRSSEQQRRDFQQLSMLLRKVDYASPASNRTYP